MKINTTTQSRSETLYLWWQDEKSQSKLPAGVAFFDSEFGDYRLKIDFFPVVPYYLRCMGSEGDRIRYRLEVVHKKSDGRFLRRVCVGEGAAIAHEPETIQIQAYPFERTLVLTLKPKSKAALAA